jgi:hypothetical protein
MKILLKSAIFISVLNLYSSDFITLGTGAVSGTYYPTGKNICKFVNRYKKDTNIRCSVEATEGSISNINSIENNELDFAIVQSDILYNASKGFKTFENNKQKNIKSVMAIYPELFTLLVSKESNITKIEDIKNKKINIGNIGSGNEVTTLQLLDILNIKTTEFKPSRLDSQELPDALINKKIDGYFYMVGHPASNIKEATNNIDAKIIQIDGKFINKLITDNPYFIKSYIKGGLYKNNPNNIKTFGVKAVLVVNKNISDYVVYNLVKAILKNFEEFKLLHPSYNNITKKSLLEGISAPLHKGAIKYYKEIGLIK